jgi:hypothetical protein
MRETAGVTDWSMSLGDVASRTAIQARHGGSRSRGISVPALGSERHDIMLWWHPERGETFGYRDGWTLDGSAFFFAGTGQEGDQFFEAPLHENGRVRDHASNGDNVRLLKYVAKNKVQYVAQLALDISDPWSWVSGPDRYLLDRRMIQFRFLPVGEALIEEADRLRESPVSVPTPAPVAPVPQEPSPTDVEALRSRHFQQLQRTRVTLARRREAELVHDFCVWAGEIFGHPTEGRVIPYAPESGGLRVDVFVPDLNLLVEAKASSERNSIRLAIGQLLDYARYFPERPRLAVLTPTKPAHDMLDLLSAPASGVTEPLIASIWREGTGFASAPASLLLGNRLSPATSVTKMRRHE